MKNLTYTILESDSASDLMVLTNGAIENGWWPQGGVALAFHPGKSFTYMQAMVKMPVKEHRESIMGRGDYVGIAHRSVREVEGD